MVSWPYRQSYTPSAGLGSRSTLPKPRSPCTVSTPALSPGARPAGVSVAPSQPGSRTTAPGPDRSITNPPDHWPSSYQGMTVPSPEMTAARTQGSGRPDSRDSRVPPARCILQAPPRSFGDGADPEGWTRSAPLWTSISLITL